MKLLSRLFTVCLLLCGLAYGSYAFGRYVLSTKLFGQAVVPNNRSRLAVSAAPKVDETVTRQFNLHADKPKVEVEVLPAEDAGPGPDPGTLSSSRHSSATTSRPQAHHAGNSQDANAGQDSAASDSATDRQGQRNISGPDGVNFWGDEQSGDRQRSDEQRGDGRRRTFDRSRSRRHRRRHQDNVASAATGAPARAESSAGGGAVSSDSGGAAARVDESSPSYSSGGDSGEPAPRHHRERTHEGHDSPVPRPEGEASHSGSSGGSSGDSGAASPVPQPE